MNQRKHFKYNGYTYTISNSGTVNLIKWEETTDKEVIVPEKINNMPVTSLGKELFAECKNMLSIVLPRYLTRIGERAFFQCLNLREIHIPDSVNTIEREAFYECMDLFVVVLPGSLKKIKERTFYECINLREIYIPDSVKIIENEAFYGCTSIEEICLPNSLKSLGFLAFFHCPITEIQIPDSLEKIELATFLGCDVVDIIISPNHKWFEVIDGVLFDKGNKQLLWYPELLPAQAYEVPKGTQSISGFAFFWSDVIRITIPNTVTSIGISAMAECVNLAWVEIPDTVLEIGKGAFENSANVILDVEVGSFAEQYAKENGITYMYHFDSDDWLDD